MNRLVRLIAVTALIALLTTACNSTAPSGDAVDNDVSEAPEAATDAPDEEAVGADTEFVGQSTEEQLELLEAVTGPIAVQEGETTRGVTDETITVAGVATLTTAQGIAPLPGLCEGAEARFARANDAGGVAGRTIDFLGCQDDGGDPARNLQLTQEAVQGDGVFAIVPAATFAPGAADFMNEQAVPYFGQGYVPADFGYDQPYAFAVLGGGYSNPTPAEGKAVRTPQPFLAYAEAVGVDTAGLRVAIVGEDTPAGVSGVQLNEQNAAAVGVEVVYAESPLPDPSSPPLTDYTPIANEILGAEPDLVMMTTTPGPVIGLATALRNAGHEGDIAQFAYADERALQDPTLRQALDGLLTMNAVGFPAFEGSGFEQMRDDLDAAGHDDLDITQGVIFGYGAADFFLAALDEAPEDLTAEGFANAINDGFTYPGIENAVCEVTWPLAHLTAPPCLSVVRISAEADDGEGGFEPLLPLTQFPSQIVDATS